MQIERYFSLVVYEREPHMKIYSNILYECIKNTKQMLIVVLCNKINIKKQQNLMGEHENNCTKKYKACTAQNVGRDAQWNVPNNKQYNINETYQVMMSRRVSPTEITFFYLILNEYNYGQLLYT